MTASDSEGGSPQDSTDPEPSRRGFMGAVAAAAFAGYADKDYSPANVDAWSPINRSVYMAEKFTPTIPTASASNDQFMKEYGGKLDKEIIEVCYDSKSPTLVLEGTIWDGDQHIGLLARLEPTQAKELARAIYQSAWEFENRNRKGVVDEFLDRDTFEDADAEILSLFEGHQLAIGVDEVVANTSLSDNEAVAGLERLVVEDEIQTTPVLYERAND